MINKKSSMFVLIIWFWAFCTLYFSPRLFALLVGEEAFFVKYLLFGFIILQIIFWFYTFYHLVIIAFSYFLKRRHSPQNCLVCHDAVALLYTTCNDFNEEAVITHLKQDYRNTHLFILDDSTSKEYISTIDNLKNLYLDQITIIRRDSRIGFKAGNVNHALRVIPKNYKYFSISDADTKLPKNYISILMGLINEPNVAFVQAQILSSEQQKSKFSQDLSINTDIHFKHYANTKNVYGFVMWYGHGALLRRDVYNFLGGLPEIATEDLAYSMIARVNGFHGIYCEDVICREEFPLTYKQYRKRNEKWIRGTIQCLLKFLPVLVRSKEIPWFEKVDIISSAGTLFFALPYMLFIILGGICLPLFYHNFEFSGTMIKLPIVLDHMSLGMIQGIQSNLFWSWGLFLLFLTTILAPVLPVFIDYWRSPRKIFNYLSLYIFCFFSVQVVSVFHLIIALMTKTSVFPITGAREQPDEQLEAKKVWTLKSHSDLPLMLILEFMSGILFFCLACINQNIWFMPLAFGLILSPILFYWNLNVRFLSGIITFPLFVIGLILYFIFQGLYQI